MLRSILKGCLIVTLTPMTLPRFIFPLLYVPGVRSVSNARQRYFISDATVLYRFHRR